MAKLTDGRGGTIWKATTRGKVTKTGKEKGSVFLFDESRNAPKGFALRVTKAGGKAFVLRYSGSDGKRRLKTIGPWPTWSLTAAREEAARLRREIDIGGDPLEAERPRAVALERAKETTVTALVEAYDRAHLSKRRYGPQARRFLDRFAIPAWGDRPVQEITRADVKTLLREIVDAGTPVTANRVLAAVRAFFNWCAAEDYVERSPAEGIKAPAEETPRDRALSDDEIRWLWKATEKVGYPFGPMARLLLLTGQRLREVAEMTDAELRGDAWTLPAARAKNKRDHAVPLSAAVQAELGALPRTDGSPFLFTTTGKTPVSGFKTGMARLREAMTEVAEKEADEPVEIPHWTFHDLRRTCATGMAQLGIPIHVTEAVLNHKSGTVSGIAAVYNVHDYAAEKRHALDAWANRVLNLVEGSKGENVVPLNPAAEARA